MPFPCTIPRAWILSRSAVKLTSRHLLRLSSSSASSPLPAGLRPTSIPLSELCIPLTPPYSLHDLLASTPPPAVLDDAKMKHLHKLSGLPEGSVKWDDMSGLVRVIEGIRSDELKELLAEAEGAEGAHEAGVAGWGKREVVIDGSGEEGSGWAQSAPKGEAESK